MAVINLGTNDFTYTRTNEERMNEFRQGYADFLSAVHKANPKSYIVCTLGTMGALELYPHIEQAVTDFVANTGYERITCYATKPLDEENYGYGTMGHTNESIQRRDADTLMGVIRKALSLEG